MIISFYHYLKEHPVGTSLFSAMTSCLSVWLADVDRLASWSATLLSIGSFIVISPKVFAQLREYRKTIRHYRRRLWACFLRTYRSRKHRKEASND